MSFSEDNLNFFRLYYVLTKFGTVAINELFREVVKQTFPSSSLTFAQFVALPQVQKDLRSRLDSMQRELLYPSGASTRLSYGDLDITLVTTLLKNVSVFSGLLKQPKRSSITLWTEPTEADTLLYPLEANVVKIKIKRNKMAHSTEPVTSSGNFDAEFTEIKDLVMGIMRHASSAAFSEDEIEKYRKQSLSNDTILQTVEMLLQSLETVEQLKKEIKKLIEVRAELGENLVLHVVQATSKTRHFVIFSLVVIAVLVLGMLAWNTLSANSKFNELLEQEADLKQKLEKEIEELKSFEKAMKIGGLSRVQLTRGENAKDFQIRKERLRYAIKMHPHICFPWRDQKGNVAEEDVENCINRLLQKNPRESFISLPTSVTSVAEQTRGKQESIPSVDVTSKPATFPTESTVKKGRLQSSSFSLNLNTRLTRKLTKLLWQTQSGKQFSEETSSIMHAMEQSQLDEIPKELLKTEGVKDEL